MHPGINWETYHDLTTLNSGINIPLECGIRLVGRHANTVGQGLKDTRKRYYTVSGFDHSK